MKKISWLLPLTLAAGTIFAWYTIWNDFQRFYLNEGTVFKINDCISPNPVTTPCFYGGIAFAIALVWSIILVKKSNENFHSGLQKLVWLLVASTVFAWGNFLYEVGKFVNRGSKPAIGCSGQLVTNPLYTPCFVGAAIFLICLIIALIIYKKSATKK
jgi:hypothetical protein